MPERFSWKDHGVPILSAVMTLSAALGGIFATQVEHAENLGLAGYDGGCSTAISNVEKAIAAGVTSQDVMARVNPDVIDNRCGNELELQCALQFGSSTASKSSRPSAEPSSKVSLPQPLPTRC